MRERHKQKRTSYEIEWFTDSVKFSLASRKLIRTLKLEGDLREEVNNR